VVEKYQDQGIIVEESANNWLRFDVFSDGSQTRIFAASVANGTPSVKIYKAIAAAAPIYLNVERLGDSWSLSYSYDGLAWTGGGQLYACFSSYGGGALCR
jgi:regulation of enolase protein 1 (concanavalin A-like superfamily)